MIEVRAPPWAETFKTWRLPPAAFPRFGVEFQGKGLPVEFALVALRISALEYCAVVGLVEKLERILPTRSKRPQRTSRRPAHGFSSPAARRFPLRWAEIRQGLTLQIREKRKGIVARPAADRAKVGSRMGFIRRLSMQRSGKQ
jgi:hypothetical protein